MQGLDQFVSQYLKFCQYQKNLDAKTIKAYRIDLRQFTESISQGGEKIDRHIIEDYITSLHDAFKPKTVKRKIASSKAFLTYMEYESYITENPYNHMKVKYREPLLLPQTCPLDMIKDILSCAYRELGKRPLTVYKKTATLRDIAVLELLFATGIRVSELCQLSNNDIMIDEQYIRIMGKGAKERIVQIPNQTVISALRDYSSIYPNHRVKGDPFFLNRKHSRLSEQSVRHIINRYASIAGRGIHVTPHMLRHTFATLLLEEDVDIRYIQRILGHSSILTTQIYTHVTSNKQTHILATKHPRNKISIG